MVFFLDWTLLANNLKEIAHTILYFEREKMIVNIIYSYAKRSTQKRTMTDWII